MSIVSRVRAALRAFAGGPQEGMSLRRWEATKTTRLNEAHWTRHPIARTLNEDLRGNLKMLRRRCRTELANNAILEGVCQTHVHDIVGTSGPTLQVQSTSRAFADRVEGLWNNWWHAPDINGELTGADFLRLWTRGLWCDGEFFAQIVSDPSEPGSVKTRLLALDIERLESLVPEQIATDADGTHVVLGIRRTRNGRPIAYSIRDQMTGLSAVFSYTWVPAMFVVHGFAPSEAGQARGVPLIAPALQAIADLRDYDAEVLDAARMAADFGVLLQTNSPEAGYIQINDKAEFERRTIRTIPPGWAAQGFQGDQPSTDYVSYRNERLLEYGRAVSMPVMMVKLDSSGHNYSSARFDGQLYHRGNAVWQARLNRHLERLARWIEREDRLGDPAIAARPDPRDVRYVWTWDKPPHVDPMKEAEASKTRLNMGISTLADELAAQGKSLEEHLASLQKEQELIEEAGITLGYAGADSGGGEAAALSEDDEPPAEGEDDQDDDDGDEDMRSESIEDIALAIMARRNGKGWS